MHIHGLGTWDCSTAHGRIPTNEGPLFGRDEYGVAPIVQLLEGHRCSAVTSAALDAVRAMSLNNDANKTALREAWVLPQLVKLLAQVCRRAWSQGVTRPYRTPERVKPQGPPCRARRTTTSWARRWTACGL